MAQVAVFGTTVGAALARRPGPGTGRRRGAVVADTEGSQVRGEGFAGLARVALAVVATKPSALQWLVAVKPDGAEGAA